MVRPNLESEINTKVPTYTHLILNDDYIKVGCKVIFVLNKNWD